MIEKVHQHIVNELQPSFRTNIIFVAVTSVIVPIVIRLLLLFIRVICIPIPRDGWK